MQNNVIYGVAGDENLCKSAQGKEASNVALARRCDQVDWRNFSKNRRGN